MDSPLYVQQAHHCGGKAIASIGIDQNVIIGDFMELTPSYNKKNKAMVLPDGSIFAFNKDAPGGDLKSLGCQGTNNYNELWKSQRIYNVEELI